MNDWQNATKYQNGWKTGAFGSVNGQQNQQGTGKKKKKKP